MTDDEAAIKDLIDTWMSATIEGDRETVLSLIDDEAVFMVAGEKPFGKKQFAERFATLAGAKIEGTADPIEIRASGEWGWARTSIDMRVTLKGSSEPNQRRHGLALSVYRRLPNDRWVLYRDANLVS